MHRATIFYSDFKTIKFSESLFDEFIHKIWQTYMHQYRMLNRASSPESFHQKGLHNARGTTRKPAPNGHQAGSVRLRARINHLPHSVVDHGEWPKHHLLAAYCIVKSGY
jgi:hypothetical protein